MPLVIPPVTAVLLSRLPDGCTDPRVFVEEICSLRDEIQPLRSRFAELESAAYSDDATIAEVRSLKAAVEADAKAIERRFDLPLHDNAFVRWFVDNVSFLVKALVKWDVEVEEVADFIARLVPPLQKRLRIVAPGLLFDIAVKTLQLEGYGTLLDRKLDLRLQM
jgi:hypothetical protein